MKTNGSFEGFAILEIIGHRKLGGYIKEQMIASVLFIRIDCFNENDEVIGTQFYGPSSIYCITPVSKEFAIAFGGINNKPPVQEWEMPMPPVEEYQEEETWKSDLTEY